MTEKKRFLCPGLILFGIFLFLSCAGMGEATRSSTGPAGTPLSLDTIKINIYDHAASNGNEIEASVLFYPQSKNYALSFPYEELVYLQYYDEDARDMFIRSHKQFLDDSKRGSLTASGLRARQFYGKIEGYSIFENPRYNGTFKSRPVLEFGYVNPERKEYFSVTQGEADIEGYPANGQFMSYRIPVYFSSAEAQKLANLFVLDPSPIVCYGDTITSGYSVESRGVADSSRAYPAFLRGKTSIPIINAGGANRETTDLSLGRLDRDVLTHDPQMVLMFFGAVDLSRQIPWQETRRNLEEMISRIDNGKRKIFIVQFYTPESLVYGMRRWEISDAEKEAFVQGYEDMYSDFSKLENVEIIRGAWEDVWGQNMSSDRINPLAAGQEIMAENIFNGIRLFLEERNALK